MTKKQKVHFQKVLRVYLSHDEYEKMITTAKQSSCRSLSEYGRKMLFRKAVTMVYRNRSVDEAVESGIEILTCMKDLVLHASFSEEEKAWIRKEITILEELTTKILNLCLPK
jgi:hypothetical protein